MRSPLDVFLSTQRIMLLDGALATELERRGADLIDPLWSAKYLIERPELIRAVHVDYFRAGADVATTATYQASFEGFRRRGLDAATAAALMRKAVTLATAARAEYWDTAAPAAAVAAATASAAATTSAAATAGAAAGVRLRPLVAASIGPYGAMLADGSEYRGHYGVTERELKRFHRARLQVLADAGADLFAFETIPCLREALVLAELLTEFPAMSAWVSFSCRDGEHNCEGESVARCAAELQPCTQIAAIGVNCTQPGHIASLLQHMAGNTTQALLAYPNSGEQYDAAEKRWHGHPDGAFAALSRRWYEAGARLIGGCCRTTPADIAALRALHVDGARDGINGR